MPLIWIIILVLFVLWLGGFGFAIGGSFIHLILLVIVALIIYSLLTGRRTPL